MCALQMGKNLSDGEAPGGADWEGGRALPLDPSLPILRLRGLLELPPGVPILPFCAAR